MQYFTRIWRNKKMNMCVGVIPNEAMSSFHARPSLVQMKARLINWPTNYTDFLSTGPLGTHFIEIVDKMQQWIWKCRLQNGGHFSQTSMWFLFLFVAVLGDHVNWSSEMVTSPHRDQPPFKWPINTFIDNMQLQLFAWCNRLFPDLSKYCRLKYIGSKPPREMSCIQCMPVIKGSIHSHPPLVRSLHGPQDKYSGPLFTKR